MKLVVITPEPLVPGEPAVLAQLFASGLERCHLRKPSASRAQLKAFVEEVPEQFRTRLVLHSYHQLVAALGLGGRHWRDDFHAPLAPPAGAGLTSRSCHDLATLRAALGHYSCAFFGPVLPSISKPGHAPSAGQSQVELAALLTARPAATGRTDVFALGGVTAEAVPRCRALGFDGVAVVGAVWHSADPLGAFRHLQAAVLQ